MKYYLIEQSGRKSIPTKEYYKYNRVDLNSDFFSKIETGLKKRIIL
jgi:hypothetical protein